MQTDEVLEAIKKARDSKKRNFNQSFDLIITFKNLNFKKPENQIDIFVNLHYDRGKKAKVCALVGPELKSQGQVCDKVIVSDDFSKYAEDKKLLKRLAKEYDFFIAQANIMTDVAKVFGRVLGPKGKMPNPKAGCIIGPGANVRALYDKLQKTIRVKVDKPYFQCMVGKEDKKDEEISDNIMTVYNALVHNLPNEKQNIKNVFVKLTMGKIVRVGKAEKEKNKEIRKEKLKERGKEKVKKAKEEKKKEERKEGIKEKKEKKEEKSTEKKVEKIVKKTKQFAKGMPKAEDLI